MNQETAVRESRDVDRTTRLDDETRRVNYAPRPLGRGEPTVEPTARRKSDDGYREVAMIRYVCREVCRPRGRIYDVCDKVSGSGGDATQGTGY